MAVSCRIAGCRASVHAELEAFELCLSHFTLQIERACNEIRLEASQVVAAKAARREEILRYIAEQGALLARIATNTPRLPDEQKARILSTFLTLMNLRESLDRAAARQAALPIVSPSPAKA